MLQMAGRRRRSDVVRQIHGRKGATDDDSAGPDPARGAAVAGSVLRAVTRCPARGDKPT
jgi:hypothetical protein